MNTLIEHNWYEMIDLIYSYLSVLDQVRFALSCKYIHLCLPKETLRVTKIVSMMKPTNAVIKTFKYYILSERTALLITNKKILGYNRTNDDCMFINRYHNNAGPVTVQNAYIDHQYYTSDHGICHYHLDDFIQDRRNFIDYDTFAKIIQEVNNSSLLDSRSRKDISLIKV